MSEFLRIAWQMLVCNVNVQLLPRHDIKALAPAVLAALLTSMGKPDDLGVSASAMLVVAACLAGADRLGFSLLRHTAHTQLPTPWVSSQYALLIGVAMVNAACCSLLVMAAAFSEEAVQWVGVWPGALLGAPWGGVFGGYMLLSVIATRHKLQRHIRQQARRVELG